jgi:FtsH-binding integral membrane protein
MELMAFNQQPLVQEAGGMLAIQVGSAERMVFLRKVYTLFSLTIGLFAGVTWWASSSEFALSLVAPIFRGGFFGYMILMLVMFGLLRVAAGRFPINLVALGLFATVEGLLTGPLVTFAIGVGGTEVVAQAAVLTGVVFGALTIYTLTSKRDFSFMRAALWTGFGVVFGFVLLGWLFGFNTSGWGVSAAFVLLMAGFVIYDTSNIMRHYPTTAVVPAVCALFLDVVIMFKHILMLLSRRK